MPELAETLSLPLALWLFTLFAIAGTVKGIAGFGLPLIAVPLISLAAPVPTAVAWTLIPLTVSNLFQIYESRHSFKVLKVIWPLLAGITGAMFLSVELLTELDSRWLSVLVGVMIQVFVLTQLFPKKPVINRGSRVIKLGALGVVSGLVGGATSFVGFPALQALLALGLSTAEFIFSASVVFLLSAVILGSGLKSAGMMPASDILISLACVLPVLLGLQLGKVMRGKISAPAFKRVVLGVLFLAGLAMILQPLL
jgi:uncharacterized membrane protein YfcA